MSTAPTLTALIDIYAFYSRYVTVTGRPTNSSRDGKEWHGSCPRCHGNDRFSFWESGRFSCSLRSSGCGWHGSSPYWFLRDEGFTHFQACDELGVDPHEFGPEETKIKLPLFMTRDDPPNKKWMDAAESFVWRAEKYLWTHGQKELKYLRGRGLSEETIRSARLGYCPGWFSESLESWGLLEEQTRDGQKEIKIPCGIVIPWFVENQIWKISVKRLDETGGYFQVLGSSDCVYNIDSLRPGEPLTLVEGEFDELSIRQEAHDMVASVATGGASKALTPRWITKLKTASHILVAFDQDENKAGDAGAQEWIARLGSEKASRWAPWAHDCNDMLQQQPGLVRTWVEIGLKSIQMQLETPVVIEEVIEATPLPQPTTSPALAYIPHSQRNPHAKRTEVGLLFLCSVCQREQATHWESNVGFERAYCKKCWQTKEKQV